MTTEVRVAIGFTDAIDAKAAALPVALARRARAAATPACALGLAMLAAFGCASGHKPHARMSAETIEARVEEEFPVGTARDEVIVQLQRRGATYDAPLPLDQPMGWSTLRLYLDQPWWAGLEWATTYTKTEAWADLLFDQQRVLREIKGESHERTW